MSKKIDSSYSIKPIGWIETPFMEKFAVPRQSSLITHGIFKIHFYPPYNNVDAFDGISEFSHLWVSFLFHEIPIEKEFLAKVRPPRLGGNVSKGVFATRSPFRPNRIGLSLVKLKSFSKENNDPVLNIEGADLVNGTPIIDIKPYIKFTDSVPNARSGFAEEAPKLMPVQFTKEAEEKILQAGIPEFKELITEVLAQDPRPAYRHNIEDDDREYGVLLYDFNVKWQVKNATSIVSNIENKSDYQK